MGCGLDRQVGAAAQDHAQEHRATEDGRVPAEQGSPPAIERQPSRQQEEAPQRRQHALNVGGLESQRQRSTRLGLGERSGHVELNEPDVA